MSALEDLRKYIVDELEDIQKNVLALRDELKNKIHSAQSEVNIEVQNEWQILEQKYQSYSADMKKIREAALDECEDLLDEARLLGKELLTRYGKVKI